MSDKKTGRLPAGIHTALVTPFAGDGIDTGGFSKLLALQLESAVSGVVVLGTTGESPTVTDKERELLISIAAEKLAGKKALTVGCGSADTQTAVKQVKRAGELGAEFALVVTPYYNRPSQRGILRHYLTVAEESSIPVVLYNVPSRTGVDIDERTLCALSSHANIVALKEASGDIQSVTYKLAMLDGFDVFCGNDTLLYHFLCLGACGGITVASNAPPDFLCGVYELYAGGNTDGARIEFLRILPYLKALGMEVNPVPIKALLSAMGLISSRVRQPLCEMSADSRAKLIYTAADVGIFV